MAVNSSWPLNLTTVAGNVIKDQMFLPLTLQSDASMEFVSGETIKTFNEFRGSFYETITHRNFSYFTGKPYRQAVVMAFYLFFCK